MAQREAASLRSHFGLASEPNSERRRRARREERESERRVAGLRADSRRWPHKGHRENLVAKAGPEPAEFTRRAEGAPYAASERLLPAGWDPPGPETYSRASLRARE